MTLNEKTVWRALREGYPSYQKLLREVPDAYLEWAVYTGVTLMHKHARKVRALDDLYIGLIEELSAKDPEGTVDRKTFAIEVNERVASVNKALMFLLFDGKDITDKVWAMIEPEGGER